MEIQVGQTKYNISIGTIIFIFTTLVAVIGAYLTLQNNISNIQEDILNLQAEVKEVSDNSGSTSIIELRGLLDVTSTKLSYIEKTLDALDSAIW